ncbi:MAG: hypothetical protein ABI581_11790 [Sediminibacterium sp.]
MIHLKDVRIGNWISLIMAGSLIAAHRILDKDEFYVSIAGDTEYTLLKIDECWRYEKQPKIELLSSYEIKGIPLSVEILNSCGFQLKSQETLTHQPSSESFVKNYYSLEDFTVISCGSMRTCTFTDKSGNVRIEFAHELQNLYFKLMNKELDITVPAFNFQMSKKN